MQSYFLVLLLASVYFGNSPKLAIGMQIKITLETRRGSTVPRSDNVYPAFKMSQKSSTFYVHDFKSFCKRTDTLTKAAEGAERNI